MIRGASLPPLDLPPEFVAGFNTVIVGLKSSQREASRSQIILTINQSTPTQAASILGCCPKTTRRWYCRAMKLLEILDGKVSIPARALARSIRKMLEDAPRSGAPLDYTAEQRCEIIAMAVRSPEEFLSDPAHRIRFVYTPKHCSWLNQIEIWFGILLRKALKNASFAPIDELKQLITSFIGYFNKTLAKPFRWTYKGIPLKA